MNAGGSVGLSAPTTTTDSAPALKDASAKHKARSPTRKRGTKECLAGASGSAIGERPDYRLSVAAGGVSCEFAPGKVGSGVGTGDTAGWGVGVNVVTAGAGRTPR